MSKILVHDITEKIVIYLKKSNAVKRLFGMKLDRITIYVTVLLGYPQLCPKWRKMSLAGLSYAVGV